MHIEVETDRNIEGYEGLVERVRSRVRDGLERLEDRVTSVQVHLGDENSDKKAGPDDKRCLLEVRLAGLDPVAGTDRAASAEQALDGAIRRALRAADKAIGRKQDH